MSIARATAILAAALVGGCAWLGPEIMRSGRPAYNDAILATSDQQLLQNIVRIRFVDSIGFLNVSSITANVSVRAGGSVDIGVGPSSNYAGNLVPLQGTLATEQNPTISYVPVSGDQLLRQFAGEVPLERAILIINSAHDQRQAWRAVVRRVNNMRNPDFLEPPAVVVDPRFEEVVELASSLQRRGVLYWIRITGGQSGFGVVLHGYSAANSREVARLIELLGIKNPEREAGDIVIPVLISVGSPAPGAIAIETPSLLDLMRLAAASIALPAGTPGAARVPMPAPAGQDIRILSSSAEPSLARVAVRYRDRWYYIDDADDSSKRWFNMLQLLASAQLPDTTSGSAPLLTIPVTGRR
jgi:hypothetical protein